MKVGYHVGKFQNEDFEGLTYFISFIYLLLISDMMWLMNYKSYNYELL